MQLREYKPYLHFKVLKKIIPCRQGIVIVIVVTLVILF